MKATALNPLGREFQFSAGESFSEGILADLRSSLEKDKLIVLRGLNIPAKEDFLNFALHFARPEGTLEERLLHWSFGPLMELKVDPRPQNYLFSEEAVPFHWDGAFHKEPSFLVFNCLQAPEIGAGGETLFTDMAKVLRSLPPNERGLLEKATFTYKTERRAHYGGEVTVNPLFHHPRSLELTLRYAEEVDTELNPVKLVVGGLSPSESQNLQSLLKERIYSPEFCYQHAWRNGDLLIADNFATIHGRNGFKKSAPRHIHRVQVL